jgi:beta-glucanase (GH16 family)
MFKGRVRGDAGACAGIFTYADADNESDIEILTQDPTTLYRLTNQPGLDGNGELITDASSKATLPGGANWTDWQTYRLDWTPTLSAWYVNDQLVITKSINVPKLPSAVILNMVSWPMLQVSRLLNQ